MAPAVGPQDRQTFLDSCLLEGDRDFEQRARRGKRRAILISIILQILIVAALVLIPLLSKGENIAGTVIFSPPVPYGGVHHPRRPTPQRPGHRTHPTSRFFQPDHIPVGIVTHDATPPQQNTDDNIGDSEISRYTVGDGDSRGIPFTESTHGPKPPEQQPHTITPTVVRRSELAQTAMLLHRVDPVYPVLARQLRREGRVELRATIATDGSIQALEVISGDPLFFSSALSAVHQWLYRPTILDRQPVEVETRITVIFHLQNN